VFFAWKYIIFLFLKFIFNISTSKQYKVQNKIYSKLKNIYIYSFFFKNTILNTIGCSVQHSTAWAIIQYSSQDLVSKLKLVKDWESKDKFLNLVHHPLPVSFQVDCRE
jgi:hypothetical protein